MTDLTAFDALSPDEQSAFLALFAGARGNLFVAVRGDTNEEIAPSFGKAECEWVPFRPTWQEKFPSLGWTTFEESEPKPALGMVPGSTYTDVTIHVTHLGHEVRNAVWRRLDERLKERTR